MYYLSAVITPPALSLSAGSQLLLLFPVYTIRHILPCLESEIYNEPSSPVASPIGRESASLAEDKESCPAKPCAKISYSSLTSARSKGTKATLYPACGSGARFQLP